ncbi:nicotinate-nicotinamide nucleotide adenylyltransferase [Nannocystis pusilla]|uniref:nicotinate-nicotinamide nucleotide adenylyltransferase n=1 Tax=Nannocystis pusilla TaxID=889268 RepID=UPI003B77E727
MERPVLAVLGGSFDPPHLGHALIPTYLLARGLADRVLVAPCWSHPFAKQMMPFADRLALTRLAMAAQAETVEVSDVEARLAARRGGRARATATTCCARWRRSTRASRCGWWSVRTSSCAGSCSAGTGRPRSRRSSRRSWCRGSGSPTRRTARCRRSAAPRCARGWRPAMIRRRRRP